MGLKEGTKAQRKSSVEEDDNNARDRLGI